MKSIFVFLVVIIGALSNQNKIEKRDFRRLSWDDSNNNGLFHDPFNLKVSISSELEQYVINTICIHIHTAANECRKFHFNRIDMYNLYNDFCVIAVTIFLYFMILSFIIKQVLIYFSQRLDVIELRSRVNN